jgi:peptidoglycan/xylan/chitin deacetylase (PgdA/CDA1 family)
MATPDIYVFFRYDDYSAISDMRVDRGLTDVLRRHGVSCTFGVIPSLTTGEAHEPGDRAEHALTGERLTYLQHSAREGLIDVALHGWNHRTHAGALPPRPSEFAGRPRTEQEERLRRACGFFREAFGTDARGFIPPWNSYDENTLRVLEANGFTWISGNRQGPITRPTSLRFAPITVEMAGLRNAVELARREASEDVIIGVMMHPYDFFESGDPRATYDLAEFSATVEWLKRAPGTAVGSISHIDALAGARAFDADRFDANRELAIERVFPPFVPPSRRSPLYKTTGRARAARVAAVTKAFASHLLLMLTALAGTWVVLGGVQVLAGVQYAVALAAAAAAVLLAVRALRSRALYFRAAAVLSMLIGVTVGALL